VSAQDSLFREERADALSRPHAYVPTFARDTTAKAAVNVLPRTGTQRRRVFDLLAGPRRERGLTDEEIQYVLGLSPNTERPRRKELCDAGLVVDSGRRTKNAGGQECVVWVLSESGRLLARGAV
jgi:hypothetical protein